MSAKFALPLSIKLGNSYGCLALVSGISLLAAVILLLCDSAYWLWIVWGCLTSLEGFSTFHGRGWKKLFVDAEESVQIERADGQQCKVRLMDCYKIGRWLLIRLRLDSDTGRLTAWLLPLRYLISSKDQRNQFHRLRLYHQFTKCE